MKVYVLGSGTLVPQAGRASAGLAVQSGSQVLILDLGRNVLSRMVEAGLDPLSVPVVLLSHLHPDHSCELVSLLFARNYGVQDPQARPLRLIGPTGTSRLLQHLQEAWPWLEPKFELKVDELRDRTRLELPGFEVEAIPVAHGSVAAFGYRIRGEGRTGPAIVAFTGDTGPCEALIELGAGADVLVAECSTSDAKAVEGHLFPTALGQAVEVARPSRLVVTHLQAGTDPHEVFTVLRRYHSGDLVLAVDGWNVEV